MVECDEHDPDAVWYVDPEIGNYRVADNLQDLFELMTARLKGGGYSFSERNNSITFPPNLSPVFEPTDDRSFWNRNNIPHPTN